MKERNKIAEYFYSKIILLFIFCSVSILQCGSHHTGRKLNTIDIRHQTVYLEPLKGLDILKTSDYWPKDKNIESILLDYIQQVWQGLLAEFRRCEKYGLYTMVDSTAAPTIVISVKIVSSRIRNDSLIIPLEIKTALTSEKKSYTLTVDSNGLGTRDSTTQPNALYYLGTAYADYKRRFPYQKVVSSFYLQEH